jgi:hypothetical protein
MTNEERKNQEARDAAEEHYANIGVPTLQEKLEASVFANLRAKGLISDHLEPKTPKAPTGFEISVYDTGYSRGYQAALNDMKKQLEKLQQTRRIL